jgi:hypothetical protein
MIHLGVTFGFRILFAESHGSETKSTYSHIRAAETALFHQAFLQILKQGKRKPGGCHPNGV